MDEIYVAWPLKYTCRFSLSLRSRRHKHLGQPNCNIHFKIQSWWTWSFYKNNSSCLLNDILHSSSGDATRLILVAQDWLKSSTFVGNDDLCHFSLFVIICNDLQLICIHLQCWRWYRHGHCLFLADSSCLVILSLNKTGLCWRYPLLV